MIGCWFVFQGSELPVPKSFSLALLNEEIFTLKKNSICSLPKFGCLNILMRAV